MSININEIQLTAEQKKLVAQLAEQTGKSWNEVLEDGLAAAAGSGENGTAEAAGQDDSYIDDIDAWLAHFNDWMSRQRTRNPNVDDSRESIYPDRW